MKITERTGHIDALPTGYFRAAGVEYFLYYKDGPDFYYSISKTGIDQRTRNEMLSRIGAAVGDGFIPVKIHEIITQNK